MPMPVSWTATAIRDEALRAMRPSTKFCRNHPIVAAALADLAAGKPLEPLVTRRRGQGAAEVLYGLGAVGGQQGDELAAMIYLRLALYLAPQNGLAIITLADIYERLKQNEQAIDVYEMVRENRPLARQCRNSDRPACSKRWADRRGAKASASASSTRSPRNRGRVDRARQSAALAQAIRRCGRRPIRSALGLVEQARKSQLVALLFPRHLLRARRSNGRRRRPISSKALELYPDQPLVLNYLGYSWVDQGINLDEAFKMLRRAVELRPTDGYIVDSLGWANYKLGHYDEAVNELERAIELKPADPVINDHLGDAYWRVGRKLEAHFQWNHARDIEPEPEDLAKDPARRSTTVSPRDESRAAKPNRENTSAERRRTGNASARSDGGIGRRRAGPRARRSLQL